MTLEAFRLVIARHMPKLNPGWTLDMRVEGSNCAVTPVDPFGTRFATFYVNSDHRHIKNAVRFMLPRDAYVQYAGDFL